MAQMPIQLLAARANQFVGQSPPQAPRAGLRSGTYLIDAGGISGGALRPGAMDQAEFKTLLAAAQKSSATAPNAAPAPATQPDRSRSAPAIPTLTLAQLAALGAVEGPQGSIPTPKAPAGPPMVEAPKIAPAEPVTASTAAPTPESTAESTAEPTAESIVEPMPESTAELTAAPTPAETRAVTGGPMPRARMGADGVWELPRMPDKDEREMLQGQKWRLVEDPAATRLFLGEDGKFGWDDFVDLINPLQHIPLVNVAYRAITGDEIDGAARLVDFAFGPAAGVSTAIDLAFRDVAGDGMAGTAVAALFGKDENGAGEYTTAAATQVADSGRHGSHR